MDNFLYNSNRIVRTPDLRSELREELLLKDLIDRKFSYSDFCFAMRNQFRVMLDQQEMHNIIRDFFKIEEIVHDLKDKNSEIIDDDFSEFYKTVAPMLMRIIWEKAAFGENSEDIYNGLRSSLLVALEEELFYWEEQVKSIDN